MNYNHEAIHAAYPDKNLLIIDDIGIFDRDISDTTPFEIDQLVSRCTVTTDKEKQNAYHKYMREQHSESQTQCISKCKEVKYHSQTMTQRLQK